MGKCTDKREKVNGAVLDTYRQAREQAVKEGQERAQQQMKSGGQEFMQYRGAAAVSVGGRCLKES